MPCYPGRYSFALGFSPDAFGINSFSGVKFRLRTAAPSTRDNRNPQIPLLKRCSVDRVTDVLLTLRNPSITIPALFLPSCPAQVVGPSYSAPKSAKLFAYDSLVMLIITILRPAMQAS